MPTLLAGGAAQCSNACMQALQTSSAPAEVKLQLLDTISTQVCVGPAYCQLCRQCSFPAALRLFLQLTVLDCADGLALHNSIATDRPSVSETMLQDVSRCSSPGSSQVLHGTHDPGAHVTEPFSAPQLRTAYPIPLCCHQPLRRDSAFLIRDKRSNATVRLGCQYSADKAATGTRAICRSYSL
jgi:hypothetical protein